MGHGILLRNAGALAALAVSFFLFFCVPVVIAQALDIAQPLGPLSLAPPLDPSWVAVNLIAPPTPLDWADFLRSIGSWGTLNRLGIAAVVTQGLLLLMRSKLGDLTGKAKLAIVTGSSMLLGVLALRLSGLDWGQSLMHSTTLAALQVFGNQLAQTYLTPKKEG